MSRIRAYINRFGKTASKGAGLLALSFALTACQGGFEPGSLRLPLGHDPEMTGGRAQDGRPFTAASADHDIQELKNRLAKTNPDRLELAKAIAAAKLTLLDGAGKAVARNPMKLKVEIRLRAGYWTDEKLEFIAPLSRGAAADSVGFTKAKMAKGSGFALSAVCADRDCEKTTLRLEQNTKTAGPIRGRVDEAAMIVRRRSASARARAIDANPGEFAKSARLEPLRRMIENGLETEYETLEVAWGASLFSLEMSAAGSRFCVSGPLVETNDGDEDLETDCPGSTSERTVRAVLSGNNNKGGLVMNLFEGGAVLVLTVRPIERGGGAPSEDEGATAVEIPPAPVPAGPGAPRIPADPDHPVTRQWEKDRGRAEIAAAARSWTGDNGARTRAFLARLQPNLPLLTKALAAHRVPNEFLTITLMESRFFIDEGYPIEVNRSGTATGPWQFLADTGRWLGLRVRPFLPGRKADPCDERAQLGPATNAAGKYLRILLDDFPNDPRLAVMSYYWGGGNVNNAVDCMKNAACLKRRLDANTNGRIDEIKRAGFDFWNVKEFNMAPAAATSYVIRFVSGQFVAREPERYGLEPIDSGALGAKPAPAGAPAACK